MPAKKAPKKSAEKGATKKKVVVNNERPEIKFCNCLSYESPIDDFRKVLEFSLAHLRKKDEELFIASTQAVERICALDADSRGLFLLLEAEGLECFHHIVVEGNSETRALADSCVKVIYDRVEKWLDDVDPIDFTELPTCLDLGKQLAALDEDVALALLSALERFSLHMLSNCVTMLEGGVLQIFHLILSVHRSPECCHECLMVMFRVLDIPGEPWVQPLLEEKELILTVVETMNHGPLNMRIQLAGFRLLCLWNQQEVYDADKDYAAVEDNVFGKDKLRLAMQEAGAGEALQRCLTDLRNGGLWHQASWMACVAGVSLSQDGLAPRVDEFGDYWKEMAMEARR